MKQVIPIVALVAAVGAIGISLWGSKEQVVTGARDTSVDLAPLVLRLDRVEARLAEMERKASAIELAVPPVTVREVSGDGSGSKLDEIVRRVAELEQAAPPKDSANLGKVRLLTEGETIEARKSVARNFAATEDQRLEALRGLRGARNPDGSDARVDVLDEMILLAESSQRAETRADVWRQMSHVTDARLKEPLLRALAGDPHAKAREEAAETLEDFLPDARVEQALRAAAAGDADEGVRRQANASLNGR